MCLKSSEISALPRRLLKRSSTQFRRRLVAKKWELKDGMGMGIGIKPTVNSKIEIRNWRLYMENKSIMEQNERLRQRALLLQQENQTLLSQLQNKLSHRHPHLHMGLDCQGVSDVNRAACLKREPVGSYTCTGPRQGLDYTDSGARLPNHSGRASLSLPSCALGVVQKLLPVMISSTLTCALTIMIHTIVGL